jgi:hypothetical protein
MKAGILLALGLLAATVLPGADAAAYRFGAGVRLSSFGIPDTLLDLALYEHPKLAGKAVSFELHSYGDRGPRSVFSGVYCLEYSRISGAGRFRVDRNDNRLIGSGEITQVNITATILMHIFPNSPIHPYIGGGLGIGHVSIWAEGEYMDELGTTIRETADEKMFIPVGHIPIGICGNINDRYLLRAEVGFKNGFYFGGSLAVNF